MPKSKFSNYLENYYLDWQKKYGRASIRKFAKWLNIDHSLINQWMNGNGKPGPTNLAKLAEKMGSNIYELLNIIPPPEFLRKLEIIYDELEPIEQKKLAKRIGELLDEYSSSDE